MSSQLAVEASEEIIQNEKTGPILGIIGAMILFGVAYFFWSIVDYRPPAEWPAIGYWFIGLPAAAGTWFLVTRFVRLADRSPKLIIKPDGIVLCHHDPHTTIPWSRIYRARYSRSTENGSETSAYVTLVYRTEAGAVAEAAARVDRLTWSSGEILRMIEQRANLTSG